MALLAAFSFDEASGAVLDYSGNGRDWTLNNNAARSATGHTNGGLTKTGALLPVVASPAFVGTSAWTMMFWRQGLGDSPWWCRLFNTAADTGSGILLLSGNLNVRIRTTGGSNIQASAGAPVDGAWHHYAATYDGTVGRLYVDATLAATTASATAPTAAVDRIDIAEHTLGNAFTDDLRFHDEALDQATITTLMNTPVDVIADTTLGTATGAGGGVGTATGTREVVAVLAGSGGGSGTATGVREVVGVASGSGGGEGIILVASAVSVPEPLTIGWDTLLSIAKESRDEARAYRSTPPTACPNDGEPLQSGPGGSLHCSFDGWVWRGGFVDW